MKRILLILTLSGFAVMLAAPSVPCYAGAHNPQAQAHRDMGDKLEASADYPGALREYQAAYALDKAKPANSLDVGTDLRKIGNIHADQDQYAQAIAFYQQARVIAQRTKDSDGQGRDLTNMADAYENLGEYAKAMDADQQALRIAQQAHNLHWQSDAQMNLGYAALDANLNDKAISCFHQALAMHQHLKDRTGEASDLAGLGLVYNDLGQSLQAIASYQKALTIDQQLKDTEGEAKALKRLGTAYENLSQFDTAMHYYQRALPMFQQIGDLDGQADVLDNLGSIFTSLSLNDKAIPYLNQALLMDQQIKNSGGEATVLNDLGTVDNNLSQYDMAIQHFQKALVLHHQVNDLDGQARDLNGLGIASFYLGQYDKAVTYFQQALRVFEQIKDPEEEAYALNSLGGAYERISQYNKAIPFFQQALRLYQQTKDRIGQATVLSNLGNAYYGLRHFDKAITFFQQALAVQQQVKDLIGEANSFTGLGVVYSKLRRDDKAGILFQQALTMFQRAKSPDGEALGFNNLMELWSHRANPRLAIFYGKQAVNVYQSIRQDIQQMDNSVQKTYLQANESTYRELAEILIKQGRLPEAEQVLGLLKDEELKDFVQRDATQLPATERTLPYDPTEQAQKDSYATLADHVTAIGAQIEEIKRKRPLTVDDAKQLTALDDQLQPAQAKFQAFLTALPKELPAPTSIGPTPGQMLLDQSLQGPFQKTLFDLGPGTVALYTIVEPDRYRVVMVTSQTQIAREYPIKSADLRDKILAFRQVLQDPTRDPRPLAHALYTILIGPIEQDLAGAKATTLMWSLDDALRYIPIAALYDGKQYLVERYRNTEFTGASLSGLDAAPPAQYTVLGLGVSQSHPGYPALPGVPQELNGIVKEGNGSAGVMDGTVLLDGQLTWEALKTDLNLGYPVVHIASHFALGSDYAHSFLLLGDGPHSLDELSTQSQIFQSASLLTLSACETAVGNTDGDGHEIESFGALAQEKGAQSIIASLWPVADVSTPLLMDGFYQGLSSGTMTKGEALRQAQLALLHGTASAPAGSTQRAEILPDKSDKSVVDAPPFTLDPKAPFAHPYYWAPFILIGNWK